MSLIHSKLRLCLGLGLLALAASAQAQLVSDGGTAVISTTTNIAADLTVGNAGPNTTLIITNGGSVTANNTVSGSSAAATNNLIAVSGAGSKLTTPGGGSVLRTGNVGAFNRLFISEGAAVSTGFGVIGFPAAASNNTVLVTDSGSVWSNSSVIYVGEGGSSNSLTIANAGRVVAGSSAIGVVASASNNLVLVTGTNSLWSTVNTINVGDAGGGSQLRVSSAGTVTATGLVLGNQASSSGNRLNVGGGNVRDTNAAGNAALDVRRGSVQFNGGNITADNLLLTNAQGSFTFNDGTLTTRAATINNGQSFVVGANAGAAPAGTNFANTALIRVPSAGSSGPASPYPSTININNLAGTITKATVTISNLSHAASYDVDLLLVSPDGTAVILMANAGDFAVTNLTLTFDDAANKPLPLNGQLTNGTYHPSTYAPRNLPFPAPLGPYSTNLATFIGSSPNGTWSLFVNDAVSGNFGGITNGWNLKLVTTTPAATWDVRSNAAPTVVANGLQVGGAGSGATLLVTNGATLSASSAAYIGYNSSAGNNRAIIAGANSFWTSSSDLYVGLSGSGNALLITNSGRVADGYAYIGYGSAFPGESSFGNDNQVTVSGANTLWTGSGDLSIGHYGSGNSLVIANGGTVADSVGHIGNQSIANNNQVTVSGVNSMWSNSASLNVGFDGSFSTLLVTSNGTVKTATTIVGANFTSSGNLLTVGNGTLTATNASANATLDVRRGSVLFNGGNIIADRLLLTNGANGNFTFNAGTLVTRTATISNGLDFVVGSSALPGLNANFVNAALITIPASGTEGPAAPYPSIINVADLSGIVTRATVTVSNLTHTFPKDMDLLLVGPDGTRVVLMAAAGNSAISGVTLTFDDASLNFPPPSGQIPSGTYHPSRYFLEDLPGAPPQPYSTNLASFNGANPNGAWSLFVYDFESGDSGMIANGWSLNLTTTPAPTWDVRSNATPTTVNGNLYIGQSASNARLLITNGAVLASADSIVGVNVEASNNTALVTGAGSVWNSSVDLRVGQAGSFNTLLIANGGAVSNTAGRIGFFGNNNAVMLSDSGSVWNNNAPLYIGFAGNGNQLTVSNGASVVNTIGYLGELPGANNNRATVTGSGSQWINHNNLYVGDGGSFNSLLIANGAEVVVGNSSAIIGNASGANSNLVTVTDAGSLLRCASQKFTFGNGSFNTLLITNGGTVQARGVTLNPGAGGGNLLTVGNGTLNINTMTLDIAGGTLVFNGGFISAPQLMLNGGTFTFNAGTFNILHALGTPSLVGDGINPATYFMSGNSSDTHLTSGLVITNHAILSGNGYIQNGIVTIAPGGTLSPGSGIGSVALQLPPILQGKITMEISKSGGTLANDFIEIGDVLSLGGSLVITNLGPDALAAGDNFQLFSATGPIDGAFSSLTLPALPAGLVWKNNLLVDGSIAVVTKAAPNISGLSRAGTNLNFTVTGGSPGALWNLLTSTNAAAPLANWITNRSGVFDWLGNASVTNGINSTEPQRYFRINAP